MVIAIILKYVGMQLSQWIISKGWLMVFVSIWQRCIHFDVLSKADCVCVCVCVWMRLCFILAMIDRIKHSGRIREYQIRFVSFLPLPPPPPPPASLSSDYLFVFITWWLYLIRRSKEGKQADRNGEKCGKLGVISVGKTARGNQEIRPILRR